MPFVVVTIVATVFFFAVFAARAPAMGNSADRAWQLSQLVEGVLTAFNPSHGSLSCVKTNSVSFASAQARKRKIRSLLRRGRRARRARFPTCGVIRVADIKLPKCIEKICPSTIPPEKTTGRITKTEKKLHKFSGYFCNYMETSFHYGSSIQFKRYKKRHTVCEKANGMA